MPSHLSNHRAVYAHLNHQHQPTHQARPDQAPAAYIFCINAIAQMIKRHADDDEFGGIWLDMMMVAANKYYIQPTR